ncbi:MAG: hypothetical protein C0483_14015 [Pirellula sp.]|nr:hypothetical protein [Pirellula sp.]
MAHDGGRQRAVAMIYAPVSYRLLRMFVAVALFATLIAGTSPREARAANDVAWAWTPYRVEITLIAADRPEITPPLVAEVAAGIERRIRQTYGAAWQANVERRTAIGKLHAIETQLDTIAVEDWQPSAKETPDKVLIVVLAHDGAAYRVRGRELDTALKSAGPTAERAAADRRLLDDAVLDVIVAAFRPVGRIVEAGASQGTIELRGAALLPESSWPRVAQPGDVYLPMLRARRRDGGYSDTKQIPWTLLEIEDAVVAEGQVPRLTCAVRTGLNNPLGVRQRGRYEAWIIGAGRPSGGTVLTVQPRSGGEPLVDCEVFSIGDGKSASSLGRTDGEGRLRIAPTHGRALTLIVASRFLPLAKAPLLPGLEAEVTVPVAADGRLRGAEDWLTDWQTEFLDLYIRRRALMAAAGIHVERGELPAARLLVAQVDRLGSPSQRIEALEIRRRAFVDGDPAAAKLLNQLFTESLLTVRALDDATALLDLQRRIDAGK